MLATIVGLGLLRFTVPGGVGAGRSGTDALALSVVAAGRCPTLQHTHNTLNYTSHLLNYTYQRE